MNKNELQKIFQGYEPTELDRKVIQTWAHKTWAPQSLRDAAREYASGNKQTASLILLAVYILDSHGLFREISRKSRENFLADFE